MRWCVQTACAAMLALACAVPAGAWEWPWRRPPGTPAPSNHYLAPEPGAGFYPRPVAGPYPPYNRVAPTPTFNYGYFGVRTNAAEYNTRSYYGQAQQWYVPAR